MIASIIALAPAAGFAQLNITQQPPESLIVPAGSPATFSVGVTANPAPAYQWRRYGYAIPGATAATYQIPAASQFDNDFYDVLITSGGTTAVSRSVRLLVTLPSYPGAVTVDLARSLRLEGRENPSLVGQFGAQAALPDGRFYFAGTFTSIDGQARRDLVRFNANGTLDPSFAPPAFDATPSSIALQTDGKLIVAGLFKTVGGVRTGGIVRLNLDGSRDNTFAVGGGFGVGVGGPVFVAPNGSIYVTGSAFGPYQGSAPLSYLARLTPTGALDTAFTTPQFSINGGGTNPLGFALGPSGEIYVHGGFDSVNGVRRNRLVRLLGNGQVDPAFDPGSGPNNWLYAMIVLSNGRLVIGGDFTTYNGATAGRIARINSDGSLDTSFAIGAGFSQQVNFLAELPNNALFVGSAFNQFKGAFVGPGVRLNSNGTLDTSFIYNATGRPDSLSLLPGNRLLVSGGLLIDQRPAVRVLEADGSLPSVATFSRPDLRFPARARWMAPLPGGKVLVAGDFTHVNGAPVPYVMRLNADLSHDTTFPNGPGPLARVTTGVVQPDGKIVVFTSNGMVRLNADGSTDASFSTRAPGGFWYYSPVALRDGRLLVPTTLSSWSDGSAITNGFVVLESNGTRAMSHPFLPGPNTGGRITGVQRLPGGQLLVLGSFSSWNGISRQNGVRLNADGSVDPAFTLDSSFGTTSLMPALARNGWSVQRDGRLIAMSDAPPKGLLARFNSNGARDTSFVSGIASLDNGGSLLVQPDDRIIVATQESSFVEGTLPGKFYRLSPNGGIDASFSISGSGAWEAAMIADNGELLTSDDVGYLHRYSSLPSPVIVTQPAAQSIVAGTNIVLRVAATGEEPLTYQWFKDGTPITGATSSTLALDNVPVSAGGSYTVVVRNSGGAVTSQAAVVSVSVRPVAGAYFGTFAENAGTFALYLREDGTGAFLAYLREARLVYLARNLRIGADRRLQFTATSISGPATASSGEVDGTIAADGSISATLLGLRLNAPPATTSGTTSPLVGFYEAGAANAAQLNYTIVGANGAAYTVTAGANLADAGPLTVNPSGLLEGATENNARISGVVQAAAATVATTFTVAGAPPVSFSGADNDRRTVVEALVNISTRGLVSASSPSFTAGFVVTGGIAKTVLVRGIGPSLAAFNVAGALPAARLEVFRGSASIAVGTDWGTAANSADIINTAARVGAFPLAANSRDASLLLTLQPGAYSAILSGQAGATGIALVEVYDATAGAIGRTDHIINISTLGVAATNENVLAAGFYISGLVPKRVLVRGAGPALVAFGLANAITRPQLTLHSGQNILAQNAGWSASVDASAIATAATQVGAFAFTNGSADSALVLNLAPGSYTAQVSSLDAPGTALVEIYEVP